MDPFVARHLQGVSRTYAIVVPMLPPPLDHAVGLAYLLMRVVDTIEDATELNTAQRLAAFDELDIALAGAAKNANPGPSDAGAADRALAALARPLGDTADERALMSELRELVARVQALDAVYADAIRACARKMMGGVCLLIERSRVRETPYPAVRDLAELREYCYYVAGVVGEMLCAIMAHYLNMPSLTQRNQVAVELGTGLQLVNILKDALEDWTHGRRYLPPAEEGDVAQRSLYRAVLDEARRSLRRGIEFVLALPPTARDLRSFCGLPIAWGAMTLARAEQDAASAKITRADVQASIARFAAVAGDDEALRGWLLRLLVDLNPPPSQGGVGGGYQGGFGGG